MQESSDDSGEDVDQRRLQLYERSRLRYYYAVVDCQDVATATHLYAECDGMEFLRSACKLDMRFVPNEQVHITLVLLSASRHNGVLSAIDGIILHSSLVVQS